jgi:membrane-bound lytic murein transglycosylase D
VVPGDTLQEIAKAFHVSIEDLRRWNEVDPAARLQEGMTLQVFVPGDVDLSKVVVLREKEVSVLPVGSEGFFAHWEAQKGRKRIVLAAGVGDTLQSIGARYGLSAASMERINRRGRNDPLKKGDRVVVYMPLGKSPKGEVLPAETSAPTPLEPLGDAPAPEALPPFPVDALDD